jgi:hypothetical protein
MPNQSVRARNKAMKRSATRPTFEDLRRIQEMATWSRHIQPTWLFRADVELDFTDLHTRLYRFAPDAAQRLSEEMRKHNVFARHQNSFYRQRAEALAHRTVFEVRLPGHPDLMIGTAHETIDKVERVLMLCASLAMRRDELLRGFDFASLRRSPFDVTIGPEYYDLRSKSRLEPDIRAIPVNEPFRRRLERVGFNSLLSLSFGSGEMAHRVSTAVHWISESRLEPHLPAALVKTAIAIEALLVFNESEPIARVLTERAAFLLTAAPETRARIGRIVRSFYDSRSGTVHGSRKSKNRPLAAGLIEGMDRLGILI